MADNDPIFFITVKSTSKKVHKFLYGSYTLYRRDLKPSGYATFNCAEKDCRATMSCRYSSKESAQESEEQPLLLR